jgi:hypothetical protein
MIPTVFIYPIMLLALVSLFLILRTLWSSDRSVACRPLPRLITPPRTRSHEPKPFAGLTYKPHCAACEQEATPPKVPPAVPPDPMPVSTRRPRRVETSRRCGPHPPGDYRGGVGLGNRRAQGHPHGGPWRQLQGSACGGSVCETPRTIVPGTRVPGELMGRVIACLAAGVGLRGTARVFAVDPHTVRPWLVAADQLQACARDFLPDVSPPVRCPWTNAMPGSAPSRTGRAVRPRPARTWRVRLPGAGWRGPPSAPCACPSGWASAPWPWPRGASLTWPRGSRQRGRPGA